MLNNLSRSNPPYINDKFFDLLYVRYAFILKHIIIQSIELGEINGVCENN